MSLGIKKSTCPRWGLDDDNKIVLTLFVIITVHKQYTTLRVSWQILKMCQNELASFADKKYVKSETKTFHVCVGNGVLQKGFSKLHLQACYVRIDMCC